MDLCVLEAAWAYPHRPFVGRFFGLATGASGLRFAGFFGAFGCLVGFMLEDSEEMSNVV